MLKRAPQRNGCRVALKLELTGPKNLHGGQALCADVRVGAQIVLKACIQLGVAAGAAVGWRHLAAGTPITTAVHGAGLEGSMLRARALIADTGLEVEVPTAAELGGACLHRVRRVGAGIGATRVKLQATERIVVAGGRRAAEP